MRLFSWSSSSGWMAQSLLALVGMLSIVSAIDLNLDDHESIKLAAKTAATGMTSFYTGHHPGGIPGTLPLPYYWWEAGAMFGALIDYWFYTGDDTWNEMTTTALLHQASSTKNFMPLNQTSTLGNDDQAFWGLAALAAAERNFPNPPAHEPQWLALAQGVFNSQAARWNTATCGGGLNWQIFQFNRGFNYKNSISNGCFFNIAARLARYTGNDTYAEWAVRTWDWTKGVGLLTGDYQFFDGSDEKLNCSEVNRIQWTYNAGVYLLGAASMYNYTDGEQIWRERVQGIIDGLRPFFPEQADIMVESSCEPHDNCLTDQRSFKAFLSRWMAETTQLAPFTRELIMPKLRASAMAAAKACTGGNDGKSCGLKWSTGGFDGSVGIGEQMAALEVIQSNLIDSVDPPVTEKNGGTSKGNPGAGVSTGDAIGMQRGIKTADKAGAWITTMILIGVILGGFYFSVS
ncbi:Glycosyl hydrolase family 76 protein [Coccidioides posadasii C735 delta SOWgp]|uniref:Mannan endo-1,6-alpha-mannosidase n=1 Tax=Coccidioides posadasii (strain C735) TaxID=222929 RepID=C5P4A1_COCP7|nr:Glycosyl hydrolase family 76 protein [Coccidioides posadasii C735 delta SOWgp]EER28519.1 Glycosyl hydrolase family 76 protein [Coccidioides posadasii C735 delta SOWgp]|eukprot:XP_003070664.1 Glycosyl hydrolase family 76 protein [Coccidioides posadasii C735 delta SOWgp]